MEQALGSHPMPASLSFPKQSATYSKGQVWLSCVTTEEGHRKSRLLPVWVVEAYTNCSYIPKGCVRLAGNRVFSQCVTKTTRRHLGDIRTATRLCMLQHNHRIVSYCHVLAAITGQTGKNIWNTTTDYQNSSKLGRVQKKTFKLLNVLFHHRILLTESFSWLPCSFDILNSTKNVHSSCVRFNLTNI